MAFVLPAGFIAVGRVKINSITECTKVCTNYSKVIDRNQYHFHPYFFNIGSNNFQCCSGRSRPFFTHATVWPGIPASPSMPCTDNEGRSPKNFLSFSDFCALLIFLKVVYTYKSTYPCTIIDRHQLFRTIRQLYLPSGFFVSTAFVHRPGCLAGAFN